MQVIHFDTLQKLKNLDLGLGLWTMVFKNTDLEKQIRSLS